MKILYIHQHFSTPTGSTGTRSYEFAKALVEQGHEVIMLCASNSLAQTGLNTEFTKGYRQGEVEGIKVIEINLTYSNYDNFFTRVFKFIKFAYKACWFTLKLDYDLVYATSTPLTVGVPGILAKKLRKEKFIFEVRDLWPELPVAMGVIKSKIFIHLLKAFEKTCYKTADRCVALSPGIAQGIMATGIAADKVVMIPNGCDIDLFHHVPQALLEKYQPQFAQGFWCVFTGAHGLANGLDAILDVAAILKSQNNSEIKFLFIGDGKIKPHLQARAQAEKLDNCIFWQPLPKKELTAVLKSVQVGLMCLENIPAFYYGTSPNKFFDYLAASLPVLVNYPGWMADLINKNQCGYAVPPQNPQSFAETLLKLAENKPELKIIGNNCYNLARSEFDRDLLKQRFLQLFEAKN